MRFVSFHGALGCVQTDLPLVQELVEIGVPQILRREFEQSN